MSKRQGGLLGDTFFGGVSRSYSAYYENVGKPAQFGVAVWKRIGKAIKELLSEERPEDAEVH